MTSEASEATPVAQTSETESNRLDPWLEDGNIVLAVRGKYFRVHRSILSSYSAVFKDMFDCSKPGESEGERSEELIEQCPVIHLHDVVTDVQIMLKAMYDRSYPLPYYKKAPFPIVSAFLRMGEKYDIERFTDEAKARLRCAFESTLSVAAQMTSSNTGTFDLLPGITGRDPHNFLVMDLLRKMGLKSPLPLAMYQCVISCPWIAVIDSYSFQGSLCILSQANVESWAHVRETLNQFRIRLAQGLRVSSNCVRSSCAFGVGEIWSDNVTNRQPFGPWRREWDKKFCKACRSDLNAWRDTEIQKTWNQIPTAFGFDSWMDVAKSNDDFPSRMY